MIAFHKKTVMRTDRAVAIGSLFGLYTSKRKTILVALAIMYPHRGVMTLRKPLSRELKGCNKWIQKSAFKKKIIQRIPGIAIWSGAVFIVHQ